jgi:hypothetical protein
MTRPSAWRWYALLEQSGFMNCNSAVWNVHKTQTPQITSELSNSGCLPAEPGNWFIKKYFTYDTDN